MCNAKTLSQDCKQKCYVLIEFLIEIYRIVIGTCLITFVPQKCGDVNCGYTWVVFGNSVFAIAFYINMITLGCFLILYIIEIIRENKIINYLEVNIYLGNDNVVVGEKIQKLNPIKRKRLYWIDTIYVGWAGFCICCFGTNTIFSGIVILRNLDNKAITGFVTNILFMFIKIYRIYFVIHTEKNIFYSAYLMNFVQFNDLDPREIEWIDENSKKIEDDVYEDDWISIQIENKEDIFEKDWVSNKIEI